MRKYLEVLVKFLIYACFFVPLVVLPSSYIFPFIVPKILLFRTLVEVMLGAYILLLIINWQEYRPKMTPVTIVLLLFYLSFFISTFVGSDPYHSFWDNHERMLGLFTVTHYIIFYLISTSIFKTWKEWRTALLIFLGAGSIVMFIGMLQTQNPELLLNRGSSRVSSTLGNSIYVSGYGLFLFFIALLLFLKEKTKGWRWVEGILGFLAIGGLLAGGSRGAVLGLLAGIVIFVLGYVIFLKNNKKVRNSLVGLVLLGVLFTGILYSQKDSTLVRDIPALDRIFNTTIQGVMNGPRWIAWEIAIESWKEKPVFGWGPNNYFYAFNKYYNPRSLEFGYGETWFDNAHNIIMNTLAVQGLFGILTYLSIFGIAICYLFKNYKKEKIDLHIFVVLSAFLVAHLVQNVTVFENPTSYLYFMFALAIASGLNLKREEGQQVGINKNIGTGSVVAVGLLVFVFVFILNVQPSRANKKALEAIKYLNNQPEISYGQVEAALNFNSPHIDDIRMDIGRSFTGIYTNTKINSDVREKLFGIVVEGAEKNLVLHPLDIRNQLILSQLYQSKAQLLQSPEYLQKAGEYFENALEKSPGRQQILYSLSSIKMSLGQIEESESLLVQALEGDPKIGESYWRLIYFYDMMGNQEGLDNVLQMAKDNEVNFTDKEEETINYILRDNK